MKTLLFSLALILSFNVFAQEKSKTPFLRVFNLDGKKIAKGKLVRVTDSTLILKKNKETTELSFENIGIIKTKHSFGNNVVTGAAIGAGTMATLFALSKSDTSSFVSTSGGSGFIIGTVVGAPLGSAAGGLLGLFKNRKTIEINGNEEQWKAFKNLFTQ